MHKDPQEVRGKVECVLMSPTGFKKSVPIEKLTLICRHGISGDQHAGTRLLDVRERELLSFDFRKGTEIANMREFSMVSKEELGHIAFLLNLPDGHEIPFGSLQENLVVSGIERLTYLPPRTILCFESPTGEKRSAALAVWGQNTPCRHPGENIQEHFLEMPGLASEFPKVSMSKRGVVGIVYASGFVKPGDTIIAKIPAQNVYPTG